MLPSRAPSQRGGACRTLRRGLKAEARPDDVPEDNAANCAPQHVKNVVGCVG